jgi:hypothetical protein
MRKVNTESFISSNYLVVTMVGKFGVKDLKLTGLSEANHYAAEKAISDNGFNISYTGHNKFPGEQLTKTARLDKYIIIATKSISPLLKIKRG